MNELYHLLLGIAMLSAAGYLMVKFVNLADRNSSFAIWLFFPIMFLGFFGIIGVLDALTSTFCGV